MTELVYPEVIGQFRLVEPVQVYDKQTVFGPIDGAAEQYFRYNFVRLYRGVYTGGNEHIVADVYELASSADAFGVQSAFLTPDPVNIGQQGYIADSQLTFWQGACFCRLQGRGVARESLKQIGWALSQAIGLPGPEPDMLALLEDIEPKPLSVHYFHAVEDLEPLLYLSTSNVLGLGMDTDCLLAKLPPKGRPTTLLIVRYPSVTRADEGLAGLLQTVLSQAKREPGIIVTHWHDDLWSGVKICGNSERGWMIAVFDADHAATCEQLILTVLRRMT
ncbi:MAG: DUF6599 family protein [Candidatus Zipacnadales bacterium]